MPNVFVPGTDIIGEEVNANFDSIEARLNAAGVTGATQNGLYPPCNIQPGSIYNQALAAMSIYAHNFPDGEITGRKLHPNAAGDGLTHDAEGDLMVNAGNGIYLSGGKVNVGIEPIGPGTPTPAATATPCLPSSMIYYPTPTVGTLISGSIWTYIRTAMPPTVNITDTSSGTWHNFDCDGGTLDPIPSGAILAIINCYASAGVIFQDHGSVIFRPKSSGWGITNIHPGVSATNSTIDGDSESDVNTILIPTDNTHNFEYSGYIHGNGSAKFQVVGYIGPFPK